MIPLEIFDSNPIPMKDLKFFQNRKVFRKGEGFFIRRATSLRKGILKSEEEFEQIPQNHEMAHPGPFAI